MRAYRAVLSARFRMLLQYRAAAVAGQHTRRVDAEAEASSLRHGISFLLILL